MSAAVRAGGDGRLTTQSTIRCPMALLRRVSPATSDAFMSSSVSNLSRRSSSLKIVSFARMPCDAGRRAHGAEPVKDRPATRCCCGGQETNRLFTHLKLPQRRLVGPDAPLGAFGQHQHRLGNRRPAGPKRGQRVHRTIEQHNDESALAVAHQPFRRHSSKRALQMRTMLWLM